MENHVVFEVHYRPAIINRMEKIMARLDLGIAGIESNLEIERVSWETSTKVDEEYIKMMKEKLVQAYEEAGSSAMIVHHIK